MKIEGYEEISEKEYKGLPSDEGIEIVDHYGDKFHYFKKAQKFPIVFEYGTLKCIIRESKWMDVQSDDGEIAIGGIDGERFKLLVKAVEKAREVMKKNEN